MIHDHTFGIRVCFVLPQGSRCSYERVWFGIWFACCTVSLGGSFDSMAWDMARSDGALLVSMECSGILGSVVGIGLCNGRYPSLKIRTSTPRRMVSTSVMLMMSPTMFQGAGGIVCRGLVKREAKSAKGCLMKFNLAVVPVVIPIPVIIIE